MTRKQQTAPVSLRYKVFEDVEYGTQVYKVWDTQNHSYVYSTCESQWAWQECNRLNGSSR